MNKTNKNVNTTFLGNLWGHRGDEPQASGLYLGGAATELVCVAGGKAGAVLVGGDVNGVSLGDTAGGQGPGSHGRERRQRGCLHLCVREGERERERLQIKLTAPTHTHKHTQME